MVFNTPVLTPAQYMINAKMLPFKFGENGMYVCVPEDNKVSIVFEAPYPHGLNDALEDLQVGGWQVNVEEEAQRKSVKIHW